MLKSGEAMSSRWSFLSCCWSFVDITASHWTIRGAGSDKVILSFKGQATGGAGLKATGDQLRLRGFVVEDTAGNAIQSVGGQRSDVPVVNRC